MFWLIGLSVYASRALCFREDFDQEEKARFGELCSGENGKAREWFAKYVSVQVWEGRKALQLGSKSLCLVYTHSTLEHLCSS